MRIPITKNTRLVSKTNEQLSVKLTEYYFEDSDFLKDVLYKEGNKNIGKIVFKYRGKYGIRIFILYYNQYEYSIYSDNTIIFKISNIFLRNFWWDYTDKLHTKSSNTDAYILYKDAKSIFDFYLSNDRFYNNLNHKKEGYTYNITSEENFVYTYQKTIKITDIYKRSYGLYSLCYDHNSVAIWYLYGKPILLFSVEYDLLEKILKS